MIGCNPSTTDDYTDAETIRKLISMAKYKGYGGLYLGYLFAYQTKPNIMKANKMKTKAAKKGFDYVIGPNNDFYLDDLANKASEVVFAYGDVAVTGWGDEAKNNKAKEHVKKVFKMMKEKKGTVYAFDLTKENNPKTPLGIKDLNNISWKELTSV